MTTSILNDYGTTQSETNKTVDSKERLYSPHHPTAKAKRSNDGKDDRPSCHLWDLLWTSGADASDVEQL